VMIVGGGIWLLVRMRQGSLRREPVPVGEPALG
jgi:hypothetical protein